MLSLFRRAPSRVTVAQLLAWAEQERARGVPLQTICQQWLHQEIPDKDPSVRKAYEVAERQLFAEMLARNQRAAEHERCGDLEAAIREYEANVADRFVGAHPYQRLQALYLARKDYEQALRVSCLYTKVLAQQRAEIALPRAKPGIPSGKMP